jgi:hypothetical protein
VAAGSLKTVPTTADIRAMVAMLKTAEPLVAQFGAPKLTEVSCVHCYDTGLTGGSAWTAGTRCTECRGPYPIGRLLSLFRKRAA